MDASASQIDPPDGVIYEIVYTDEHMLGLWRHLQRSKRRSQRFMRPFRIVAGLTLAGLIVLVAEISHWQHWPLPAALLGILGILLFSRQIDEWRVTRRWRKALSRNTRARISFSSEGQRGRSEFGQASAHWTAFTQVLRFPDGFLIFSGPYLPRWFPNAALVQGTSDDVAALFKQYVPSYQTL